MTFPLAPLSSYLGTRAGRLAAPSGVPTASGAVFVLGSDIAGTRQVLRPGDYLEVTQRGDLLTGTPVTFVRSRVTVRAPAAPLPTGVFWRFTARVDASGLADSPARITRDLGGSVELFDLALPTRGLVTTADAAIAYRLELVGGQSGAAATILDAATRAFTANASTSVFTAIAHGFADGDAVHLTTTSALPLPLTTGRLYYITQATADTFRLAAALDGSAITLTTAGAGTHHASAEEITLGGLTGQSEQSVGRMIALSGATNAGNNGTFVITRYLSPTSVCVRNVGGVYPEAASGAIGWSVPEFDVELPAVYLDSATLDTSTPHPALINRVPHPDETGVGTDTAIAFELSDPVETPDIGGQIVFCEAYVNDVLAYATGSFEPGFDGPAAQDTAIDGGRGLRVVLDPTTDFAPLSTVTVRVRARVAGAFSTTEYTYSFQTEDLVAPGLAAATATARRTVRLTFNEPVNMTAGPAGALNPSNWQITVASTSLDDGLPAYPAQVASVAYVNETTVDITLDDDMTDGALYRAQVAGVEDRFGNPVAPGTSQAFAAYAYVAPAARDFDLLAMLPDMNTAEDESRDLEAFVKCAQEVTDVLLRDIDAWTDILDPDRAPEAFVDGMLADLGNPFSFDLSLTDKRRLVRLLVPIYQQKGTDAGIVNAVRFFLGLEVTIETPAFDDVWVLGVSLLGEGTTLGTSDLRTRLSFRIRSAVAITAAQEATIAKIANYMKDARTHLVLPVLQPAPPPPTGGTFTLGVSLLGAGDTLA